MGYLIFCLTTAIMGLFVLLDPVIRDLKKHMPLHNLIAYWPITYLVFFFMAMLLSPILVFSVVIPKFQSTFKEHFLEAVKTSA